MGGWNSGRNNRGTDRCDADRDAVTVVMRVSHVEAV